MNRLSEWRMKIWDIYQKYFVLSEASLKNYPTREALSNAITEASKLSRQLFNVYLVLIMYGVVTALGTTDEQLVFDESANLPIINVPVSRSLFFIAYPIILLLIYVYFHIYLHRLEQYKKWMRTILNYKESYFDYPWIYNLASHPDKGLMGLFQRIIVFITIWLSLPFALSIFAWQFLRTHIEASSYIVSISPLFATIIVIVLAKQLALLQEDVKPIIQSKQQIYRISFSISAITAFVLAASVPFAVHGIRNPVFGRAHLLNETHHKNLIERSEVAYEGIYWGDFTNLRLEGANLVGSNLERADIRYSRLDRANLESVRLDNANLDHASLRFANLSNVSMLDKVSLSHVDFTGARFSGSLADGFDSDNSIFDEIIWKTGGFPNSTFNNCQMRKVCLSNINVEGVRFQNHTLKSSTFDTCSYISSKFYNTFIDQVVFNQSNLSGVVCDSTSINQCEVVGSQIDNMSIEHTIIEDSEFKFCHAVRVKIHSCKVHESILRNVVFYRSSFDSTEFMNCSFEDCYIIESDFRTAEGLEIDNFSKTRTLLGSQFAKEFKEELFQHYPTLFDSLVWKSSDVLEDKGPFFVNYP